MVRTNVLLLVVLVICALGLVSSQHKARRLVTQLEQEQTRGRTLDIEFGQLQLEQSTWAMHARVERIAGDKLRMRPTDATRTFVLPAAGERK
jgi:cell division protein FtsL